MMAGVRRWIDSFLGQGDAAPTIPPMDGALYPNNLLEAAAVACAAPDTDNIVSIGGKIYFTSGSRLMQMGADGGQAREVRGFDRPITCLAHTGETFAAGFEDGSLALFDPASRVETFRVSGITCPTAMVFDGDTLIVCNGSTTYTPSQWKRDLMLLGATGSVHRLSIKDRSSRPVAGRLGFPTGVCVAEGQLIVSEAWRHRLVDVVSGLKPVLEDLPGYPSRIAAARDGGYWLCIFAPKRQLVEYMLREHAYRERMIADLDEQYWVAPSLTAASSGLEPMQHGALKIHGKMKPWAPSLSYGLLLRLDTDFRPVFGWHSRADGKRHGIVSCVDAPSGIYIASRGNNQILRMQPDYDDEGVPA
jgi:WD40 repeat protein